MEKIADEFKLWITPCGNTVKFKSMEQVRQIAKFDHENCNSAFWDAIDGANEILRLSKICQNQSSSDFEIMQNQNVPDFLVVTDRETDGWWIQPIENERWISGEFDLFESWYDAMINAEYLSSQKKIK